MKQEEEKTNLYLSLLNLASFKPIILGASAWLDHTFFAHWFVNIIGPNLFVELETHYAVSYFSFCKSTKDNKLPTKCYTVDTWNGDFHAGFYGQEIFNLVKGIQQEKFWLFFSVTHNGL